MIRHVTAESQIITVLDMVGSYVHMIDKIFSYNKLCCYNDYGCQNGGAAFIDASSTQ